MNLCKNCKWYTHVPSKDKDFENWCSNPIFRTDTVSGHVYEDKVPCRRAREFNPHWCGLEGRYYQYNRQLSIDSVRRLHKELS